MTPHCQKYTAYTYIYYREHKATQCHIGLIRNNLVKTIMGIPPVYTTIKKA